MLIGVPMAHDIVLFNGARIYGPLQMSHLLANWKQVDLFFSQKGVFKVSNYSILQIYAADVKVSDDRVVWPETLKKSGDSIWSYQAVHVVEKAKTAEERDKMEL